MYLLPNAFYFVIFLKKKIFYDLFLVFFLLSYLSENKQKNVKKIKTCLQILNNADEKNLLTKSFRLLSNVCEEQK
jgi:hypothetical protein